MAKSAGYQYHGCLSLLPKGWPGHDPAKRRLHYKHRFHYGDRGYGTDAADAIGYSASKGALIAFTKDLAAKWAKYNIRVNAIAPGWFPTDMTQSVVENQGKKLLSHIPMGKFGEKDDLKGAVVFLASAAAKYVIGTILPVDGGYLSI